MQLRMWGGGIVLVALLALGGCASPPNVLKVTTTGGDALPKVAVSPTGQVDVSGVGIGDTVVFAPGSMRSVVAAPQVTITLIEPGSVTEAENKKQLSINRREGAKIEVMKGRLLRGDFFQQAIAIDLTDSDPKKYDIDLVLLAFNRGDKPFRGDLTVYDLLPPELQLLTVEAAAKYTDRRGVKGALQAIPLIQFIAMGMDNFSRSSEGVDVQREQLDQVHKYTFRRLVLEPGQGVGFTVKLRYQPPGADELNDLRLEARPIGPGGQ
jgi:hypothetical protein